MKVPKPRRPPLVGRLRFLLWAMVVAGVPVILGQLVFETIRCTGLPATSLDFVEVFAGTKRITQQMRLANYRAASFEIEDDPVHQDINSGPGYANLVRMILSTDGEKGGGLLSAIVCSTWVPINLGTSKRSPANPLGRVELPSVAEGNLQAARMALVLQLATALGLLWLLEQPCRSLLMHYPRLASLFYKSFISKESFAMWKFGHKSRKPTWLWSNAMWLSDIHSYVVPLLRRRSLHPAAKTYYDAQGRKKFHGDKGTKATQAYPVGFARAVVQLFGGRRQDLAADFASLAKEVEHWAQHGSEDALYEMLTTRLPADKTGWADAQLDGVFAWLLTQSPPTE